MVAVDRMGEDTPAVVSAVSADGTTIAAWRSGTGPALLLVHGSTVDHTAWDALLPDLQPHFTVYVMDRRGRGGSGDSPTYAVEREFEDVAAVVAEIGSAVHVAGHSWGALCALEAAVLTPNIAVLVLYDPPVIGMGPDEVPTGLVDEVDGLIAQERRDEAAGMVYEKVLGMSAEMVAQLRADPSWESRVTSAHTVTRELRASEREYHYAWSTAPKMEHPTLLITGELSPPRLRGSVAALHAILPNSRVAVLQGHGHAGLRTAPKLVAAEIVNFL